MIKAGRLLRHVVLGLCIGAIGVVAILTIRAPTKEAIAPICEIEISMELPTDIAQPFGSLFEISDQDGNLIASAFAPQTSSLFHCSEGRHASFFVKGNSKALVSPRQLARPSQDSACSTLFTLQGELFATTRAKLNTSADLKVLKDGVWQTVTERQGLPRDGLQFAIPLQGALLVASDKGVEWGGVRVFTPKPGLEQKYFYHYTSGFLVAYEYGDLDSGVLSRLRLFKWVPGDPPTSPLSEVLTVHLPVDYPLCFGEFDRRILFAMNGSGKVYAIDLTSFELKCIFENQEGSSWQGYCITRYYDRLLIGQYPTGQMFETYGQDVTPFHARLPLDEDWPFELQSVGHLDGQLVGGTWPWGQMFRFDGSSWRLLGRCFTEPPTADLIAPYSQESEASGQVSNAWGQRVNTIVQFNSCLFVATMNKGGSIQGEEILGGAALRYGGVLQFPLENHLDWSIRWGKRMTLVFRVWQDHAEIYQDGSLVASGVGDFTAITKASSIRWGTGIAGDCVGLLTTTRLSCDGQQGRLTGVR
jgi:hypothetical protein